MKVLSLGGSQWQIELLHTLSRLGHETFVVDINPDCPGRLLAAHFIEADTSNRDVVLEIARTHGVDLIIAEQSDRFVPVAAFVSEALALPGIGVDIAKRFTDKFEMRRQLQGVVAMPAYAEVATLDSALEFAGTHGYPLVVKPKTSQSSFGVFKVDDETELRDKFDASLVFSKDGQVLVEVFINGPEITVEGLSIDGHFHLLAVSEKEHYLFNPCVARRLSYPPRYSKQRMDNIHKAAANVVNTLGLVNGISHAEYRMLDDVPYLVEVAARGGGTRIAASIVPHIVQFSVYELLLQRLSGREVSVPASAGLAAVLLFLDFSAGLVKAIKGLEQIREDQLASEIVLNFGVGDVIRRPEDDTQRLGYAIVLGSDRDDVDARCRRIQELLVVEYA